MHESSRVGRDGACDRSANALVSCSGEPAANPASLRRWVLLAAIACLTTWHAPALAQRPAIGAGARQFVRVDTSVVALTNVRVIDGTGAPARANQTLVIRDGVIAAVGDAGKVTVPAGAAVLDLSGKTVLPGLVQVHEHLYYPTGPGVYANLVESFV